MASEPFMMYLLGVNFAPSCSNPAKRVPVSRGARALSLLGLALTLGTGALQAQAQSKSAAPAKAKPAVDRNAIGQKALNEFQRKHRAVEALVAKKAKDSALSAQVDGLLNYSALAQAALGGNYAAVCKTRCAEFESALTDLIRGNYLRFLRKSKEGKVEYLGAQVGRKGSAVKIKTVVHPSKSKKGSRKQVKVSYILQRAAGQDWRVVDIITEGVSLRKTYRYEFQKIIERPGAQGGIDGVIAKIRTKLAELAKKH